MKNSKEYSKKIQKLFKDLKSKYSGCEKVIYEEPVEAIVFGVLSEDFNLKQSENFNKLIHKHFVDYNDLRVSLPQEICETIDVDVSDGRDLAQKMCRALRKYYYQFNTLYPEKIKKGGKRQGRQMLEKLEVLSDYVLDYCMLTAFDGHAIPLTPHMVDYLKDNDLVHPDSDYSTIEGFLCRLISANDSFDFYMMLRQEAESWTKPKKEKKKTKKTKTRKKKTTKKRTTKKKTTKKKTAKKKVTKKKTAKKKTTKKKTTRKKTTKKKTAKKKTTKKKTKKRKK